MMVWVIFVLTSVVIVFAATRLAKYGDVIAVRTRLGGIFVGTLVLAGATSLPEVLTTISALSKGAPDLAAGNLLGSNMFNMLLLAVLDMIHPRHRLLRKAALKHALSGSLAMFMIGLVVFFILADIDVKVGWVGVDSILLILIYVIAIRFIQNNPLNRTSSAGEPAELPPGIPSMRSALIGFFLATVALIIVTPIMVNSSLEIAEMTGLGSSFIGTTLVALVTSLPELVTTITAIKYGAEDMAVGNLFGSNLFNMAALGLTDIFYLQGRFLGVVDPVFVLAGLLGLIMTGMGLIGNLARLERRIWFIEVDASLLLIVYFAGMWFLYMRGAAP